MKEKINDMIWQNQYNRIYGDCVDDCVYVKNMNMLNE